jgi:hypothetical protein
MCFPHTLAKRPLPQSRNQAVLPRDASPTSRELPEPIIQRVGSPGGKKAELRLRDIHVAEVRRTTARTMVVKFLKNIGMPAGPSFLHVAFWRAEAILTP